MFSEIIAGGRIAGHDFNRVLFAKTSAVTQSRWPGLKTAESECFVRIAKMRSVEV
jgi:hypothetical protein